MLQYNSRVGHQRPKVVRFQSRISLEVFEKRGLVGVVIRICPMSISTLSRRRSHREYLHDCFTHMSFFHTRVLLRPPCSPFSLRSRDSARGGEVKASSGDR